LFHLLPLTVLAGGGDFNRLSVLEHLAHNTALIFDQYEGAGLYACRRKQAEWWRRLELFRIYFDPRRLTFSCSTADGTHGYAQYAATLLSDLLDRSCAVLGKIHVTAHAFSSQFGVDFQVADLIFAATILKQHQSRSRPEQEEHRDRDIGGRAEDAQTLLPSESAYLNHVLFGSKSAESDEQSRVYGSIKDRHRQWHDRRSSSHQQMPPAFVHRLLSNVLPTLMQQDYEAIEYVCGALLRANEMAIVQGDSKCQEEAPQLLHLPVPFLGESVPLFFCGLSPAETADCERNVEVLSLLRTLKLLVPVASSKGTAEIPSQGLRLRVPFFELVSPSHDERCAASMRLVDTACVHKVSLLSRPLGLQAGECYALLVRSFFNGAHDCTQFLRQPKTMHWLMEIENLAFASETAEAIVKHCMEGTSVAINDQLHVLECALRITEQWQRDAIERLAVISDALLGHGRKPRGNDVANTPAAEVTAAKAAVARLSLLLLRMRNKKTINEVGAHFLVGEVRQSPSSSESATTHIISPSLNALSSLSSEAIAMNPAAEFKAQGYLSELLGEPAALAAELYKLSSDRIVSRVSPVRCQSETEINAMDLASDGKGSSVSTASSDSVVAAPVRPICFTERYAPCSVPEFHAYARQIGTAAAKLCADGAMYGSSFDLRTVQQQLVKRWLELPLSIAVSPLTSGASARSGTSAAACPFAVIDHQLSDQLQQQIDGSASVFRAAARSRAENEDEEMALRIAFVVGGANDVSASSLSTTSPAVKMLLDIAYGRFKSIKQSRRAQLRALRALSLVASPVVVARAHILSCASSVQQSQLHRSDMLWFQSLAEVAVHGVRLGQIAWLEELQLPTTGLLSNGLGAPLVRALWRDHLQRYNERYLLPLLCDIMLSVAAEEYCSMCAGDTCAKRQAYSSSSSRKSLLCQDGDLWLCILRSMCDRGLWRDLLELLPRLSSVIVPTRAFSSAALPRGWWGTAHEDELVELWEKTLRRPLDELEQRQTIKICVGGVGNFQKPRYSEAAKGSHDGVSLESHSGLHSSAVLRVLELVVAGIKTCPFPNRLNLDKFKFALSAVENASRNDFSVDLSQ
jgi:hypothetical protein